MRLTRSTYFPHLVLIALLVCASLLTTSPEESCAAGVQCDPSTCTPGPQNQYMKVSQPASAMCNCYGGFSPSKSPGMATPCKSVINNRHYDAESYYVPVGSPIPYRCRPNELKSKTGVAHVDYNPGGGAPNDWACRTREHGNDPCDESGSGGATGTNAKDRVRCCKKTMEKTKPCHYWQERNQCVHGNALAAASRANQTVGWPTKPFVRPEEHCISQPTVPHKPGPFNGTLHAQGGSPVPSAPKIRTAMASNEVIQKAMKQMGMGGMGPSALASLPGCEHGLSKECITFVAENTGNYNEEVNTAVRHALEQYEQAAAEPTFNMHFLETPAYSLYDPAKYRPGMEQKMREQLKDTTQRTPYQSLTKINPLVGDAFAALPNEGEVFSHMNNGSSQSLVLNDSRTYQAYNYQVASVLSVSASGGGFQQALAIAQFLFDMKNMISAGMKMPSDFDPRIPIQQDAKNYRKSGERTFKSTVASIWDADNWVNTLKSAQFAYLNTPAYAVYDPNDYRPGEEIKLAKQLEGKTIDEVMTARSIGLPIVNESVAALGGNGNGNLMGIIERVVGNDTAHLMVNSQRLPFRAGTEFLKADYGIKLANFFGGNLMGMLSGGGGNIQSMIQQIIQFGTTSSSSGTPPSCTPSSFGNVDQCIASLAKYSADTDVTKVSAPGCPGQVLQCMGSNNTPSALSSCYNQLAIDNCSVEGSTTGSLEPSQHASASAQFSLPSLGSGGSGIGNQILNNLSNLFSGLGSFGGGGNPMSKLMDALKGQGLPKTMADYKKKSSSQVVDPTHTFSPREKLSLFPERHHYSPCLTNGSGFVKPTNPCDCQAANKPCDGPKPLCDPSTFKGPSTSATGPLCTKKEKKYNLWVPLNNDATNAVRCSGQKKVPQILVDVLENRYDEFNCHQMQRTTYNRWCKGDPGGCCIRCTCPPKPCPCSVPCWSSKCWGVGIDDDNPPCAIKWNYSHDIGFTKKRPCCGAVNCDPCNGSCRNGACKYKDVCNGLSKCCSYCYHWKVKSATKDWALRTGADFNYTCAEKDFKKVCEELGECLPGMNKIPMEDIRELDKNKQSTIEGACYMKYFGNKRPYMCLDTTGKEYKQTGSKPNLGKMDGAMICANPYQRPIKGAPIVTSGSTAFASNSTGGQYFTSTRMAAWANAGGGNAQNPGSNKCCIGGQGGQTGNGCGGQGMDPNGTTMEVKATQMFMFKTTGLNCIPDPNRVIRPYTPGSQYTTVVVGGNCEFPVPIGQYEVGADKKNNSDRSQDDFTVRLAVCPGAHIGNPFHPDSKMSSLTAGGCKKPKMENGIKSLAKKREQAGGSVIILKDGGAPEGEKPKFANFAFVQRCGDDGSPYCDVVIPGMYAGHWPNSCGETSTTGQQLYRRVRSDKLPQKTEQLQKDAGFKKHDCRYALDDCLIKSNVEWFSPTTEDQVCGLEADANTTEVVEK